VVGHDPVAVRRDPVEVVRDPVGKGRSVFKLKFNLFVSV
jgi:hypothetical protein